MTSGSRSRARKPRRTRDPEEVIRRLGHVLELMVTNLIAEERDRFVHEITDAIRSKDFGEIHRVLSAWLVVLRIRCNPDAEPQAKALASLVRSRDLYEGENLPVFRSS
jgi:hypothetical protein